MTAAGLPPQLRIAPDLFLTALPASAAAGKKTFTLTVENKRIEIGLGLTYDAWTYDGAVPGPVLRVREGDEVTIKLVNPTTMAHGIDTHAAEVAPKLHFAAPNGQRNLSYSFRAGVPGAFLYQCSAIPTLSHVANGMYGMMIVDPAKGWPAAHEVMIVQGEYYGTPDKNGMVAGDSRKEVEERPDFVVFNGMIDRYVEHPIRDQDGRAGASLLRQRRPQLKLDLSRLRRDFQHGLSRRQSGRRDARARELRGRPGRRRDIRVPRPRTGRLRLYRPRARADHQGRRGRLPRHALAALAARAGSVLTTVISGKSEAPTIRKNMVKIILQLYPVIPAASEEERAALRPIGRNRELYHQTLLGWHDIIKAADEMGLWGAATIEHHFWSEGYEVGPTPACSTPTGPRSPRRSASARWAT